MAIIEVFDNREGLDQGAFIIELFFVAGAFYLLDTIKKDALWLHSYFIYLALWTWAQSVGQLPTAEGGGLGNKPD